MSAVSLSHRKWTLYRTPQAFLIIKKHYIQSVALKEALMRNNLLPHGGRDHELAGSAG